MLVHVTTDNNISGSENLNREVEDILIDVLDRFGERITRVNVHLADENSRSKMGQNDKRCTVEARLAGLQPIAVSEQSPSVKQAVTGAADKLEKTLERMLGRLDDRKGRASTSGDRNE